MEKIWFKKVSAKDVIGLIQAVTELMSVILLQNPVDSNSPPALVAFQYPQQESYSKNQLINFTAQFANIVLTESWR